MCEKEIVKVSVRVQEAEYYDRILLLVGEKFVEIVKVGETIEDRLKMGKIARVAASPGSSGTLKKKREEIVVVSYGGKKTPEALHIPKVVLGLRKIPTKLAKRKLVIPVILQFIRMLPPLMQMSKLHYIKIHPQITKIHLPLIQIIFLLI